MKKGILFGLILIVMLSSLVGCGGGGNSGAAMVYGGVDPKGDYISIAINSADHTVSYHNYTTGDQYGPFSYSQINNTALNHGFQNLYETENVSTNSYVRFIVMEGVSIIYQEFTDAGTIGDHTDDTTNGNPVYAFYRRQVSINNYKGTAYNWVKFQMESLEGNFEAGFAAFDSNTAGTLYGAGYNSRQEHDTGVNVAPYGVNNINPGGIVGTSLFTYDSATLANTYANGDTWSLVGTESGDFILDFGLNKGAGIAIRQAADPDYNSSYNGTYLFFMYKNDSDGSGQQIVLYKVVISAGSGSNGHFKVFRPSDNTSSATPLLEGEMQEITTLPNGPTNPTDAPIRNLFRDASGCLSAQSSVVQQAYNCAGGFVYNVTGVGTSTGGVFFFDPNGRFVCMNMFDQLGPSQYNYEFGFGIKDPDYSDSGL